LPGFIDFSGNEGIKPRQAGEIFRRRRNDNSLLVDDDTLDELSNDFGSFPERVPKRRGKAGGAAEQPAHPIAGYVRNIEPVEVVLALPLPDSRSRECRGLWHNRECDG
jgi:hypothetical protein